MLSQYHTITVASINQEERKKWVNSINQNNSNSDFYDVLTLKKRNLEAARQQHPKGKRVEFQTNVIKDVGTPPVKREINKSQISQPSTAPDFEYKDQLPPELMTPAGPQKDPNNYFRTNPVFSSHASISSGSAIEPDSSYGSYSDISRCRSESRILECSHGGSVSSVEHETGSLGSRGILSVEERFNRGVCSDSELRDVKFDLSKKLSVIEESQNQSDRSSYFPSQNNTSWEAGANAGHPVTLGYRRLSEEKPSANMPLGSSKTYIRGALSSDNVDCDNFKTLSVHNQTSSSSAKQNKTFDELSSSSEARNGTDVSTTTVKYSRSGSIESDV